MSVVISDMITDFNSKIGDTTNDRISASDRLDYLTVGVRTVQEKLLNDHQIRTYVFNYFDTINYYNVTSATPDLLETNDLNTTILKSNGLPFTRKSSQELRGEVGNNTMESCFSVERRDSKTYLIVNHESKYTALIASSFDSLTGDGGNWVVDAVNSDATNLRLDNTDGSNGTTGCLAFDILVAQSANNRATIQNLAIRSENLTSEQDIYTWILDIKFPSITNITSVTFYWGSSSSNYWSVTATTQHDGSAFVADWNTLKFTWLGATKTGTPDVTAITFFRIDVNYGAGQADATSFKLDNLRLTRPESLTLSYTSWYVGTDNAGNKLTKFGATTDIPYFSGLYDGYSVIAVHYAAMHCFSDLRLFTEANSAEKDGEEAIKRLQNVIPKSITREEKSFKVRGMRMYHGRRYRRIRPN